MRKRREPKPEGCALWVVTFGDTMSLLVTFFVLLITFADFESHALQETMGALKGGFRMTPMPMATAINRVDHTIKESDAEGVVSLGVGDVELDTGQGVILEQPGMDDTQSHMPDYYVQLLDNGVSLVISQQAVFEYGTATLVDGPREPWLLAAALMRAVDNEVRVTITIPRGAVVLMDNCTTAWGLGIEQALAVQSKLVSMEGGAAGQIGTCVNVVEHMPGSLSYKYEGIIEIRYVGSVEALMRHMPARILQGTWRQKTAMGTEAENGQRG